jgi:hypothetical protein
MMEIKKFVELMTGGGATFYSDVVYLDEGESRQQDCLTDETV